MDNYKDMISMLCKATDEEITSIAEDIELAEGIDRIQEIVSLLNKFLTSYEEETSHIDQKSEYEEWNDDFNNQRGSYTFNYNSY